MRTRLGALLWLACGTGVAGCPVSPSINPAGYACDDNAGQACPIGYACVNLFCVQASTTGSGTSSGSGSGGTTGCAAGIAAYGVNSALGYAEIGGCHSDSDCCGQRCVIDPYLAAQDSGALASSVCESTCMTTQDCNDPNAVCRDQVNGDSGYCRINACGAAPFDGGAVNGTWGGLCDAGDGAGTCIDLSRLGSGPAGLCTLPGTASPGEPCRITLYPTVGELFALLCPLGQACLFDGGPTSDGGMTSLCVDTCDPAADGGECPTGFDCTCAVGFAGGSHGHIGYCTDGGGSRCP